MDGHDKSIATLDAGAVAMALSLKRVRQEASDMQSKSTKEMERRVERDLKSVSSDVSKMNKTVAALKKKTDAAAVAAPPPPAAAAARHDSA